MSATIDQTAAEEVVGFFAEGWRIGATDPERFYAHFGSRLTPDALMTQPLAAPARGPEGLRELFAPLFEAVPDLTVDVLGWGATEDGVLIEIKLHGTLSGRPLEWTAVDRITLGDGLIAARHSYFDPLPVLGAFLRRPQASAPLLRALLARRGRS
jgi:hypothetical protein